MADHFDSDGYNSRNFRRNSGAEGNMRTSGLDIDKNGDELFSSNEKAGEYMRELLSEKIKLNSEKFPFTMRLIDQEVQRVQANGRVPARDSKYMDVLREKPVKVTVKALVPSKEYPKFNFVGKLLGPKGNTMKQIQEDTMCKMAVLGRGSMRDKQKEEDLRSSLDPKFAHLSDDLHVEISALAPPAEAHARIAYALAEVKKYLIPENTDMMRPNPMMEAIDRTGPPHPPVGRPMSHMPLPQSPMVHTPSKNKATSILDRARPVAESYSYDEPYRAAPKPPARELPQHSSAREPDYYYDHNQDQYYQEDEYYKDNSAPTREYKQSSARNVGTRRQGPGGQQLQRHARTATYTRNTPYARTSK